MTLTVSTDGSALGNPNGPMGWAWADHNQAGGSDAGGATNGTNQIGELCAVLEALRAHTGSQELVIETDSQYAINCSTKWVKGWKKNGWKNSQKQPVKNAPLVKAIDEEISKRPGSVTFVWVKGHAGNAGNEQVDELARTYAEDCRSGARDGYLPAEGWHSLMQSSYADGLDIPSDAKLLLDGAISPQDYHLGRGASTNRETTKNQDAEVGPTEPATATTGDDTRSGGSPGAPTAQSSPNRGAARSSLTVSGTLHFTPPPSSSPTFDGKPRYIRGTIHVEGYVQADGTIALEAAAFRAAGL